MLKALIQIHQTFKDIHWRGKPLPLISERNNTALWCHNRVNV